MIKLDQFFDVAATLLALAIDLATVRSISTKPVTVSLVRIALAQAEYLGIVSTDRRDLLPG